MLLTSLDLDPYASGRSIDVTVGDLFSLGLNIDLLVISAYDGFYEGLPGSLVAQLKERCSLDVGTLTKALGLRAAPLIRGWVTEDLESNSSQLVWPSDSSTRFRRLAIIESPPEGYPDRADWPAFNQLFCLLALLPLNGINCCSVASPLLSAGNHGIDPQRVFPSLMARCRDRLRHLPDLERLVIFDRNREAIKRLAEHIDHEARRSKSYTEEITIESSDFDVNGLKKCLVDLTKGQQDGINTENINDIYRQLNDRKIQPVVLGTYLRRLIENLIRVSLKGQATTLYQGLQILANEADGDSWLISCLHQVRVYSNWMVHDQTPLSASRALPRTVLKEDVVMVLMALHRALKSYPWLPADRGRLKARYPRIDSKRNIPIRRAGNSPYLRA